MSFRRLTTCALLLLCTALATGCGGGNPTAGDTTSDGGTGGGSTGGGSTDGGSTGGGSTASRSAGLNWSASSSTDTVGYRVYWGTRSGVYEQAKGAGVSVVGTTSYTVNGLLSGQTYYFTVTAYDAAGNESGYGAEVSKLVQ